MERVMEMKKAQRAEGTAYILAIGNAHPPNIIYQTDYPDYYFRVTNSNHKTELKQKFKRICEKTKIRNRHFFLTEEMMKETPSLLTYGEPSHDARRAMTESYISQIGAEAALNALKEWGQPKSKITHLIVYATVVSSMPGTDYEIAKLLKLENNVDRMVLYLVGCHGGPHLLKHAMDIAENNKGARVLVVYSEISTVHFHGPSKNELDVLVGQALFGDGAAAVFVGADPNMVVEKPVFQLIHGIQTTVSHTSGVSSAVLEMGQRIYLHPELPFHVSKNVENCLKRAFDPLGISDCNSLFWIVHNGSPAILDQIEVKLGLNQEKLEISRHVLSEYGNMASVGVIIMLDEMRKISLLQGKTTTGLGLEWGVMFGFGPGLTIVTIVLRGVPMES